MLYVAWHGSESIGHGADGPWGDLVELHPGLLLIDSDATRSAVYHAVKHHVPPGTPLLVAALADDPKFSRMAPGATAWLRARSVGGSSKP